MTYATTSGAARSGLPDRLGTTYRTLGEAIRRRRLYGRTYRELASLSERELSDLGIHRALIGQIASEAAYGK